MKEKKPVLAVVAVLLFSALLLSLLLNAIPDIRRTVRFTPESSLPADTAETVDTIGIGDTTLSDTLTTDTDVDFVWEIRDYSMENFFRVYQDLSDDIPVTEIPLPSSPEEESYGMRMIVDQGYLNDVHNIFNETVKSNPLKKKSENLLILGTHSYTFHLNPGQAESESFILYDGGYLEYNGYLYEVNAKYVEGLLESYRRAPEFSHCIVGNYKKAFQAENILYEELGLTYVMKDGSRYITPFTYEAIDYYWDNVASFDHVLENDEPILSLSNDEIVFLYDYVCQVSAGNVQTHLTAYLDPLFSSVIPLGGGGTPTAYHEIVTPDLENSVRTIFLYFLHMLSGTNSFVDLSLAAPDYSTDPSVSPEWYLPSSTFMPEGDELLYLPQFDGIYSRTEALNRWFYGNANESPLPCWLITSSDAIFYSDLPFVVDIFLPL